MLARTLSALAVTALLAAAVLPAFAQTATAPVAPAAAPTTPEAGHDARIAQMKIFGRVAGGLFRGTSNDKVADTQTLIDGFTNLPSLFAPETATVNTLPNIWTDNANFLAFIEKAKAGAVAANEGAKANDQAKLLAGMQAVGATCNDCHNTFRGTVGL
jgi:cytochrome c556